MNANFDSGAPDRSAATKPAFRARRILSYWTPWEPDRLAERVAAIGPQVLQIGHFGPLLASLAHTEQWAYFGVPVAGIDEQHAWWRRFVGQVQSRGVKVVGLISLGYFFGDHEQGWGFCRFWDELWDPERLGDRPCDDVMGLVQVDEEGRRKYVGRGAETRNWYSACLNNPDWIETLKRFVQQGIEEIGLDGFNSVYNYVSGCCCDHCQTRLRDHLRQRCAPDELRRLGIEEIDTHRFASIPFHYEPGDGPLALECVKFTHLSLKRAWDEVFVGCGRALKADLITATWFHNYGSENFGQLGNDERSALPSRLWARDEDYLWYSLGRQEHTHLAAGHLADVTLESRYLRAAAGGKPFIPNHYDERRLPLYAAESLAAGGAAIGWHWDTGAEHSGDEVRAYVDCLAGLFRFVGDRADVYEDVEPYADCALVFPRMSIARGHTRCGRTLRRLARRLADAHVPFEVAIDEQLAARSVDSWRTVIFAEAVCCDATTFAWVRRFAAAGGQVLLTGGALTKGEDGEPQDPGELADLGSGDINPERFVTRSYGDGRIVWLPDVPRDEVEIDQGHGGRPVGPPPGGDDFGHRFVGRVVERGRMLETDASWTVRFHVSRQDRPSRLLVHILNFDNEESSAAYLPVAAGPLRLDLRLPDGAAATAAASAAPWGEAGGRLPFVQRAGRVALRVPSTRVYRLVTIDLG